MARPWRLIEAALSVGFVVLVAAPRVAAQQRLGGYRLGPDGEPVAPAMSGSPPSAFALFSGADRAVSALFTIGYFNRTCLDNIALADIDASGCGPFFQVLPGDVFQAEWFRSLNVMWGVPPGDWNRAKVLVPSLANVRGGGWTVSDWHQTGLDDTGPLDGSLGLLHSGATSTADNTCRDHRAANTATNIPAGNALLAGSNCPATWGSAGWIGAQPVPQEVWEDRFRLEGSAFRFDFWRVSNLELDAAGLERLSTIGDFQAYGVITDANRDILAGSGTIRTFGTVVPGGSGAPTRPGWPLGLDVRVDAFSFRQLALADVAFYQAVIVNNSRRVYGVGLDYDSLYFAIGHGWFSDYSQDYVYDEPELGAIIAHSGTMYPCALSREVNDVTCSRVGGVGAAAGNRRGKAAIVVLKSPIGDLRNKWLTRSGSPFYDPASPVAGDTITFSHHHMCGFRACSANTFSTDPNIPDHERRAFGMLSSTEANVLGTRTTLTDQVFWHTFRSYAFPSRAGSQYFNRYVPPGNWDWNHDGVRDTLFLDMCRSPGGCSVRFSDTTVNGKMGAYSNVGAVLGVGPIRLRAGDTTAFVIAITSAADTAGLVENVTAAIAAYMDFYPRAVAPPPGRIVGTEAAAPASGGVRLVWDETAERSAGGLLDRESRTLLAAAASSYAGKLRLLNPRLADTLAYLAQHALARVHVFKSCDDGRTWTGDADCRGDSVSAGPYAGIGWLPYASLASDTAGDAPNTFADRNVAAGHTYTYALVTEAREVRLPVVRGDSVVAAGGGYLCVRGCRPEILEVQAASFSGLWTQPGDPGVARVYVPASTQAGARAAVLAVTDSAGPMPSSRLGLSVLADTVVPGSYRVRFGATALAVRRTFGTARHPDSVLTRVELLDGATTVAVLTGRNAGGYAVSGGTTVTALLAGLTVDTTRFTAGPVLVVSRLSGASEEPLLVSATLTGVAATPAAFYGLSEFPGFALAVDARLAGTFDAQAYVTAAGDTVRVLVEPAVTWQVDAAQRRSGGAGDYVVTWAASAFGPLEPFALDLTAPQQTAGAVRTSLEARAAAALGATDAAAAAAVAAALGRPITAESLVALRLPFAVRNASYGRDVTVAMLRRPDDTVMLGAGADTLRVRIPADAWVPGDRLVLLEPDSTGAPEVTWAAAVLGCDPVRWTRLTCNPLRLRTTGATVWLGPLAGMRLRVRYHEPATSRSTFTVRADAPLRGSALAGQPDSVRAGLAAIRVVPNPYLIVSQLPGSGILFTHLPPRGVLRIYSVSGTPLFTVRWDEAVLGRSGDFRWLLRNSQGDEVMAGLYIFVVTAYDDRDRPIGVRRGKFVIIR